MRRAFDAAIDLAAGFDLLIQQHDVRLLFGQQRGCRQSRGAGTNYRNVPGLSHRSVREPFCRRTCMPAVTGVKQAWRLPTPSISIRHSKQTPIMQYGARRNPDAEVVRKLVSPASNKAAATESPGCAITSLPS